MAPKVDEITNTQQIPHSDSTHICVGCGLEAADRRRGKMQKAALGKEKQGCWRPSKV